MNKQAIFLPVCRKPLPVYTDDVADCGVQAVAASPEHPQHSGLEQHDGRRLQLFPNSPVTGVWRFCVISAGPLTFNFTEYRHQYNGSAYDYQKTIPRPAATKGWGREPRNWVPNDVA